MEEARTSSITAEPGQAAIKPLIAYEDRLNSDLEWAMEEGSRHFEERSKVHEALRRIAKRLDELAIPYAIAEGMALFRHGYRRYTEDVDILVTKEGLKEIHERLEGRGYLPPFARSKHLRDTELGVRIEFLIAGQYPGDGKPKPVAFPDPVEAAVDLGGIKCVRLDRLIEMKLASGMTSAGRVRDLADVQAVIEELRLKREFAESLNEYVRPTYEDLWIGLHGHLGRFIKPIGVNILGEVESIDDLIQALPASAASLEAMKADGIGVEELRTPEGRFLQFVTTDPEVAARHDMRPSVELMDLDEPDDEDE